MNYKRKDDKIRKLWNIKNKGNGDSLLCLASIVEGSGAYLMSQAAGQEVQGDSITVILLAIPVGDRGWDQR